MSGFETEFQVRFGHVDPAGIVYFPRIFDYLHDVFEELWEHHVGQRYYHLLLERKLGFPLVHSDVRFDAPLRFGDRPRVLVTSFKVGRSSLGLLYRVFLAEKLHVEARMTTVCVDVRTMESVPMPDDFRAKFEAIREPVKPA